jgi:NAD(P)-dependent dehydrogenase (short-subunit alcohol dehydrogenase family)
MTSAASTARRHVIISGGSRGLGRAIVSGLLESGYAVSTFSRNKSEFIQRLSGNDNFFFAPADLSDGPSTVTFLKSAHAAFGDPYGLINCAAIAADGKDVSRESRRCDSKCVVDKLPKRFQRDVGICFYQRGHRCLHAGLSS